MTPAKTAAVPLELRASSSAVAVPSGRPAPRGPGRSPRSPAARPGRSLGRCGPLRARSPAASPQVSAPRRKADATREAITATPQREARRQKRRQWRENYRENRCRELDAARPDAPARFKVYGGKYGLSKPPNTSLGALSGAVAALGCMVGGMIYQNPPPHPHDNTAAEANAHKGMTGHSMALMLLVVVLAITSTALGFGPVASWVAGWSGMPLSVSGWVWCFFVLLLFSGLNRGVRRVRVRRHRS